MSSYNEESIQSLGLLGGIRAKPASVGIESNNHTFIEILANSIDEASAGHGDKIEITKHEDGSVTIRDYGRGLPMGKNNDGNYVYKKILNEMYAGGKYDNNEGTSQYTYSTGTNGLGMVSSNYTSDFFTATSFKPEGTYFVHFEKGVEVDDSFNLDNTANPTNQIGTAITWRPSAECFRGKGEIDDSFIKSTLQDQSIVNGGLKFTYKNRDEDEVEFYYENGVVDYIKSISNEEQELSDVMSLTTEQTGKDNETDKDYRIKADIYFSFNRETSYSRIYHNSSWLENGGTPEDFIRNSFTFAIDKYIKEKSLYQKNEKKVTFEDVSDSLVIISSTYSTISLFTDQTKKKIGSDFMRTAITKWLREQLEAYFIENPMDADRVVQQVLVNKRSRESAEKTRLNVRKKLSKEVNNLTGRIEKFVNCKSKDPNERELLCVEGDSALGSIKQARDPNTQAMYALRGKILNTFKASVDRALSNDIITDLFRIIDTGIEVRGSKSKSLNTFDINKLTWNKIILTSDQDVDGAHINTLILTLLYRFMPQLIEQGKIYIAVSPLYELTYGKDRVFAYSEQEKDKIVDERGSKCDVQRFKGLGQATTEIMYETVMNPETRNLVKVTMDSYDNAFDIFDSLMGSDVNKRRQVISDYLEEYAEGLV